MSISRHQAVGAYRRWEPPAFDEAEPGPAAPIDDTAVEFEPEPDPLAGLTLPTADDIERMHEEARAGGHAEGHAAGHAEGFASGREAGFAAGVDAGRAEGHAAGLEAGHAAGYAEGQARAAAEAARLAELADNLDQALSRLDEEVADELLGLAVEIARRMVGKTLAEQPEAELDTVRGALLQLPQGHAQIRLHPDDLALVREHMGEQLAHAGHRLLEDGTLTPGGCRVETPGAQLDATVETRWQRILASLGRDEAQWETDA